MRTASKGRVGSPAWPFLFGRPREHRHHRLRCARRAARAALRGGSAARPLHRLANLTSHHRPRVRLHDVATLADKGRSSMLPPASTMLLRLPMLTTASQTAMVQSEMETLMATMVPKMLTGAGVPTRSLGASLRDRATLPSPLRGLVPSGGYPSRLRALRALRTSFARRLAPLTAACRTAAPCRQSQHGVRHTPRQPRAGAARRARLGPRFARPGRLRRLRASPRLVAVALRASPVPASPCTGLRTAPCSRARTSADTFARASGSALRATAFGAGRSARHSSAVAAPLRRLRRRRFPHRSCRRFGRSVPRGGLGFHTRRISDAGAPWPIMAAINCATS